MDPLVTIECILNQKPGPRSYVLVLNTFSILFVGGPDLELELHAVIFRQECFPLIIWKPNPIKCFEKACLLRNQPKKDPVTFAAIIIIQEIP